MFLFPHGVDYFFKVMSSSDEFDVALRTHLEIHFYGFANYNYSNRTDLDRAEILARSTEKVSIGATKYLSISLELLQTNLERVFSSTRSISIKFMLSPGTRELGFSHSTANPGTLADFPSASSACTL